MNTLRTTTVRTRRDINKLTRTYNRCANETSKLNKREIKKIERYDQMREQIEELGKVRRELSKSRSLIRLLYVMSLCPELYGVKFTYNLEGRSEKQKYSLVKQRAIQHIDELISQTTLKRLGIARK